MKTVLYYAGILALSAPVFYSCRTVYVPNAVNTPMLQEKGELKVALAANNLQVATAVTQHVGLMVNGYLNAYTSDDKSFKNNGKGAEVGIGYFGHTAERISYEAYGGSGLYNVRIKEANNTKTFDADAVKYFIQPSVGWVNPFFELAVTPRVSVVKYGAPDITGYTSSEQTDNYFHLLDKKAHAFLEPTITLRGGYRFVKLQVQYGHVFKFTKNNINYEDNIGSVGLIFDIGTWYRKE